MPPCTTEVVNIDRDDFDVYVGRAGKGLQGPFGNYVEKGQNRYERVAEFHVWFYDRIGRDDEFRQAIEGLRGKRLGCFCMPLRCHGMVIVEYLEGLSYEQQQERYIEKHLRKTSRPGKVKQESPLEPDMFEDLP